jgi:hypothetical protein
MSMKPLRLTLVLASAAMLTMTGCGGGGENVTSNGPAPSISSTQTGVVADGLLAGAKVCLDLNENRVCDAGEPTASTKADGSYEITGLSSADVAHTLLVEVRAGITTDSDYGLVTADYSLMAPAGKGAFISPITTLIQALVDGGAAANVTSAESQVATALGSTLPNASDLYSNFTTVANLTALAKIQGVAQILAKSFAATKVGAANVGLTPQQTAASIALSINGVPFVAGNVSGPLTLADRDKLYATVSAAITPSASQLKAYLAPVPAAPPPAPAPPVPQPAQPNPIEGAWFVSGTATPEIFIFMPDGKFVFQKLGGGAFGDGHGFTYGSYGFVNGVLSFTPVEKGTDEGPGIESFSGVVLSGDTLTFPGGTMTRSISATSALVGAWVPTVGFKRPEYILFRGNGKYVYGTFPFEAPAAVLPDRYAGYEAGDYIFDSTSGVVSKGATTADKNGIFALPLTMGLNADGTLTVDGTTFVKLGTMKGARATLNLSDGILTGRYVGKFFKWVDASLAENRITAIFGVDNIVTYTPDYGSTNPTLGTSVCEARSNPFSTVRATTVSPTQNGPLFQLNYANKVAQVGTPDQSRIYELYTFDELNQLFPRSQGCAQPNPP